MLGVVAVDVTGEVAVVRSALELLGDDTKSQAAADLVAAEASGRVVISGSRIAFAVPTSAAAWLLNLEPEERRAVHRALADVLTEPRHREMRAEHLVGAAIGPDTDASNALAELGQRAAQRGATRIAAEYYTRAAPLAGDPEVRALRMHLAADSSWNAGDYDAARAAFSDAFIGSSQPALRADTMLQLGQLEMYQRGPRYARDLFLAASKAVEPYDIDRAANLLVHAASTATLSSDIVGALSIARQAELLARGGNGTSAIAASLMVAFLSFHHGDTAEFDARFPELSRIAELVLDADVPEADLFLQLVGMTHVYSERWDTGRMYLTAVGHGASRRKRSATAALASATLAELCWRSGRWEEASALVSSDLVLDVTLTGARLWLLAFTAHIDAGLGRTDECRSRARLAIDEAELMGFDTVVMWARHALGLLELGLGSPSAAAAHLDRLAATATAHGLLDPSGMWWQADHVEALLRAGRRRESMAALARLEVAATQSDRVWPAAAAARCRALLAPSADAAEVCFAEALTYHARLTAPFELARTLLCRAEHRAAQPTGPDPTTDLDEAAAIFVALGAVAWGARVQAVRNRVAAHAAPPPHSVLSPAERRVAAAVAEGLTNREVAAQLHVGEKTVEFHLHNCYLKLGITSRTQLVRLLTRA